MRVIGRTMSVFGAERTVMRQKKKMIGFNVFHALDECTRAAHDLKINVISVGSVNKKNEN